MEFTKYAVNLLNKLNLYILPHYIWLIILYYLMINVFYKYFLSVFKDQDKIITSIPNEVIQFNSMILHEIDKWLPLLWFLGFAFIFSGIFIGFIQHAPILHNKKISEHGIYGLFLGPWLLFIAITIEIYNFSGGYFPFFIFVITLIKLGVDELKDKKVKPFY
ncbi:MULTISPECIES: hypothetical protein [Bacillus]|uniref:hypothetical protein n=1 Tax=Bacillus TaxID=1386 RepID=UPI0002EB989D|nr:MULTISPECIES: hypothetical protein [Bacillus]